MIKAQLARKMAANLGRPDTTTSQPSYTPQPSIPSSITAPPVNEHAGGAILENGGVHTDNNGERASNASEDEIQTTLVRSTSPSKTREPTPAAAAAAAATVTVAETEDSTEEDPADHMRKLLGDIVNHSRAAIKAGDDKVALAVSAYNWVSRRVVCLTLGSNAVKLTFLFAA